MKGQKIIHICSDEKFIQSAYLQFEEVCPKNNLFFLIVDDISADLKYVETNENFILVKNNIKELKNLYKLYSNSRIICFHGLDYYRSIVLNNTPQNFVKIWFVWGFEFYNNTSFFNQNEIIGHDTFKKFIKTNSFKNQVLKMKDVFRSSYYKIKKGTKSPDLEIKNAINKSDYCAILYKEEFDLIKSKVKSNMKQFVFSYYPIEKMLNNLESKVYSDNILLGNSASESNNHIEVFKLLQDISLGNREVLVPLSYGNSIYRNEIIAYGGTILKGNFKPLINFMPLQKYNELILRCGIVIMNHYRQQGVGNVLTMLYLGAKVYLNEQNTMYSYLKRKGIYIYSIDKDLIVDNIECLSLLTTEERAHNRAIIFEELSSQNLSFKLNEQILNL